MFQDSNILNKQKKNTVGITLYNVGTNTYILVWGMCFTEKNMKDNQRQRGWNFLVRVWNILGYMTIKQTQKYQNYIYIYMYTIYNLNEIIADYKRELTHLLDMNDKPISNYSDRQKKRR
jgi:hypothetical protein